MRWSGFLGVLLTSMSGAGELVFHNQDVLKGEIIAINSDHLLWASEAIGQVVIPKDKVSVMYTSLPLKRLGVDEVCYWIELDALDALIQCEGDDIERIAFASLSDIIVYEGYANLAHKYEGRLVGVGSQSRGNKRRQDWLVDVDIMLRHYEYRHTLGLKYDAEAVDDKDLEEEFEITYALDWFVARRTFLFADSSGRKDDSRDIEARYTLGSGIGYQFFDTAKSALSLKTGGEYVYEQGVDDSIPAESFFSWRLATSYRYLFPRSIAFYLSADFLQSVDVGEDWEAEIETGMSLPIAMGITADVKYEYDYDNTPQDQLENSDSTLRIGFGYQW